MNKPVDYDEMFGTSSGNKRTGTGAERHSRYDDDSGITGETVEEFRKRHKNGEGFFARSDSFASLQGDRYSRRGFFRRRRTNVSFMDVFFKYIDGFAIGGLLALVMWKIFPGLIPVTIAATIGFIAGVVLKYRVHDKYSWQQALTEGIPSYIAAVLVAVVIIVSFRNA